ncbi:MAG: glutaredoxin family protein [Chloroflexi bacterium]|nr:glutaredoxin family protein [Chloroflexota bacterium]
MVKVYLSQRGIPFTERNVSLDPQAKQNLMKLGYQSTPVTFIGDQKVIGFNPMRLQAALATTGASKK